jgi:hypothetical protein
LFDALFVNYTEGLNMAVRKKTAKKRATKKKVVVDRKAALLAKLREDLKAARADAREANAKTRQAERQVQVLLKLLESTQSATDKFLAGRIKDATKKYGIATAKKKRRRKKVAKKRVARK